MPTKKRVARSKRSKPAKNTGKAFEKRVAELYRLLGAHVVQNIEICQKKVDVLATFALPGSKIGHRVIVECKDEKRAVAQNQRVMQFKGLLDLARKADEADSAAIITRVPWSDQAKGFARSSGIELLTYARKVTQLMDFTAYLRGQVEAFEKKDRRRQGEPPLGAYYVEPTARRSTKGSSEQQVENIQNHVSDWVGTDGVPHLAILGEYGTGKTSLCRKIAYDLAAGYLETDGLSRVPLLFNLRDFTKTLSLESVVTSFLDERCGILNPRFRLFQAMNEAGVFLLIFDGFDEMAVRVDADTLEANLAEIDNLASADKAKVILTSRLEYFVTAEEETASLRPKGTLLTTRNAEYEAVTIQPWDDKQIADFLKKRVPLVPEASHGWRYYKNRIDEIPGLADLSRRPVLLEMIVKTLPTLIESGRPIDRPNLYETYLRGELHRQKIVKRRRLLLSEEKRFSVLKNLALDFTASEMTSLTFAAALDYIKASVNPPRSEVEAYTRDFLSCSFLVRKGDDFVLSHRSLLEFLAASALIDELNAGRPRAFRSALLDPVVAGFVAEMVSTTRRLWSWVRQSAKQAAAKTDYLSGNAVTILCLKDGQCLRRKDLSSAVLRGANFGHADLLSTNFSDTVLDRCDFAGAKVSTKRLSQAHLLDCRFTLHFYGVLPTTDQEAVNAAVLELGQEYLHGDHEHVIYHGGTWQSLFDGEQGHTRGWLSVGIDDAKALASRKPLISFPPWITIQAVDYTRIRDLFANIPESMRKRPQIT